MIKEYISEKKGNKMGRKKKKIRLKEPVRNWNVIISHSDYSQEGSGIYLCRNKNKKKYEKDSFYSTHFL